MPPKKKTRRVTPNLNIRPYWPDTPVEALLQAETLVELVYTEVLPAIEEAIKTKKTSATLFQINSTDAYLELPRASWINAIDSCILYLSQKEKYEVCEELAALKTKLNKAAVETV